MKYKDLREFIDFLEKRGELKRIQTEVDPHLEMTEICDRTLRAELPCGTRGFGISALSNRSLEDIERSPELHTVVGRRLER